LPVHLKELSIAATAAFQQSRAEAAVGTPPCLCLLSMIGIMKPPIFAVMEPVKRVEKGSSDLPLSIRRFDLLTLYNSLQLHGRTTQLPCRTLTDKSRVLHGTPYNSMKLITVEKC